MKLYFVRHGETEWNVKKKIQGKTDIPLNENGIRQAKELACQLVEEDISVKHVYHSPQPVSYTHLTLPTSDLV